MRSAAAPIVAAATRGTRGVELPPPTASATHVEVPESTETAAVSSSNGRERAEWARVRGLAPAAHLRKRLRAPPRRHPSGGGGERPRRTQRRHSAAPTAWERLRAEAHDHERHPLHTPAHGAVAAAGAQLLWLKEGLKAVLSKCSDAASSTHLLSRCCLSPCANASNFGGPEHSRAWTRREATTFLRAIDDGCEEWPKPRPRAPPTSCVVGG